MITRLLILSAACFVIGAVVRFDSEDYRKFLALVMDALRLTGVTAKEIAFTLGVDKARVSRMQSGDLPISGAHIAQIGAAFPEFFQNLAIVIVRERGLSPNGRAAVMLDRAVSERRTA